MIDMQTGAVLFGFVIGWLTYYTLRNVQHQVSDIAGVIGALGGTAVLSLFPTTQSLFAPYALGLFLGFLGYFAIFLGLGCLALGWRAAILKALFGENPVMVPTPPKE